MVFFCSVSDFHPLVHSPKVAKPCQHTHGEYKKDAAMTQIQIKIITLFVIGLLLGPTYHFYCYLFSGQNLSVNNLREISDRWVLDDRSIFRISSGMSYKPVELPLTPIENNLLIEVTCKPNPCNPLDKIALSLSSGSNVAFQETLTINSFLPFRDFTTGPISIVYPEQYMILVEPKTAPADAPSVVLSIKKNVASPSHILLAIGYGFCLLPLLFLLKSFRVR